MSQIIYDEALKVRLHAALKVMTFNVATVDYRCHDIVCCSIIPLLNTA